MGYQFNAKDILITQLGEEGVAFNSATNEYFSLNETSFKILRGIESNLSVDAICGQLENEYEISAPDCREQVNNTIQLFISKKLITEE
ncbi:PqqD family protein [Niabella sp. 22666]|uniref:PqqD family protein n=1 Tax=Niabella sp. 22666 TaxID=3453954 RepID=UPI003F84A85F